MGITSFFVIFFFWYNYLAGLTQMKNTSGLKEHNEGVMLTGKMEVMTDQATKDMIWRKGDTMFYKQGVTDPDYCVLKFTADKGRYYCDLKTESFEV